MLAAFLVSGLIIAAALLRWVWRRRGPGPAIVRIVAWMLPIVVATAWVESVGPEYGVSFMFLAASIAMLLVLALSVDWQVPAQPSNIPVDKPILQRSNLAALGTFVTLGPLAATATCLSTVALIGVLPLPRPTAMALAAFVFPLVWAVAAAGIGMRERTQWDAGLLTAVSVLSGVYLWQGGWV